MEASTTARGTFMSVSVAWIDGHWGHPDILNLPLSDRGLQLADGLFETILILEGQPILLEEHLKYSF